jgi:hypothetical protein
VNAGERRAQAKNNVHKSVTSSLSLRRENTDSGKNLPLGKVLSTAGFYLPEWQCTTVLLYPEIAQNLQESSIPSLAELPGNSYLLTPKPWAVLPMNLMQSGIDRLLAFLLSGEPHCFPAREMVDAS